MNTVQRIEEVQTKLYEIKDDAMSCTVGNADALHDILIDLIDSVRELASVVKAEAEEVKREAISKN
jgi:hypothetical protein